MHLHVYLHRTRDAKSTLAALYDDLTRRMLSALTDLNTATTKDAEWDESKHPRAEDGRFGTKPGVHEGHALSSEKPTTAKAKSGFAALHEVLSSGHSFTREELMKATGIDRDKKLGDYLAMLKNPKYAGKLGALKIERNADGTYQVKTAEGKDAPALTPPVGAPAPTAAPVPSPAPTSAPVPAPKPAALKTWKPAKTAKEATRRAVEEGFVDDADFGSISAENANALMDSFATHVNEFPELKASKRWFLGTSAGYVKYEVARQAKQIAEQLKAKYPLATDEDIAQKLRWHVSKPRVPGKAWAVAWRSRLSNDVAITVNQRFMSSSESALTQKALKHNVDAKFHPPGCDTIKSVMDHEMGHQLDFLLGLSDDPRVVSLCAEASRHEHPGMRSTIDAKRKMTENVSAYAFANRREFIAEAWAESRNNPEPRPIAKRLAEIIRSTYEAKFKKASSVGAA